MSDGKFLTDNTKQFLSDVLYDEIKLNGFVKIFKRQIINIALNMINKYGDKYVPDRFDVEINLIAVLCGKHEWEAAAEIVGKVADGEINMVGDQDAKSKMFINGAMFIASFIQNWIEKRK